MYFRFTDPIIGGGERGKGEGGRGKGEGGGGLVSGSLRYFYT